MDLCILTVSDDSQESQEPISSSKQLKCLVKKFEVGEKVWAKYSKDGFTYPAKVMSITGKGKSCLHFKSYNLIILKFPKMQDQFNL